VELSTQVGLFIGILVWAVRLAPLSNSLPSGQGTGGSYEWLVAINSSTTAWSSLVLNVADLSRMCMKQVCGVGTDGVRTEAGTLLGPQAEIDGCKVPHPLPHFSINYASFGLEPSSAKDPNLSLYAFLLTERYPPHTHFP